MGAITRRHAIVGGCTFCMSGKASAQPARRGCFARRSSAPQGFRQIREILAGADIDRRSGNDEWDRALDRATIGASEFFGVLPGVGIYDDADEPNALAYDYGIIAGTDGTVAVGQTLMRRALTEGLDNGVSLVAVLAHEFAHIFQYAHGIDDRLAPDQGPVRLLELHADFYAGLYLSYFRRNTAGVRLFESGRAFEQMGDTRFNEPDHHGASQERVRAIEFGFRVGQRNLLLRPPEAIEESIRYVTQTFG